MKKLLPSLLNLIILSSIFSNANAQYFTHNWSNDMGNNGPGSMVINASCTNNQNHYFTVGRISGTVDVDFSSNTNFINGNQFSTQYSAFIAEYDSSASLIRAYSISPITLRTSFDAIAVDNSGNIIVAGTMLDSAYLDPNNPWSLTYSNSSSQYDPFLAKYDASMNLLWVKTFPNMATLTPLKIEIDNLNNIILAGEFNDTIDFDPSPAVYNLAPYNGGNNNYDAFLTKFDSNGNLIWAKNLGTNMNDDLGDIDISVNNDIFIGVSFSGSSAFIDSMVIINTNFGNFIGITKFSSAGQVVWNKPISGSSGSNSDVLDIEVNSGGEVFFTGKLQGNAYFQNPSIYLVSGTASGCDYIAKLAMNGDCIWAYAAYTNESVAYSLAIDAQSNFYLTGTFIDDKDFDYKAGVVTLYSLPTTAINFYIASYDSSGSYRWAYRIPTLSGPEVDCSPSGKLWINGDFNSNTDFDPGPATNSITTTNASEFITNYTSNGTYQNAYAFRGTGTTKEKVTAIHDASNGNIYIGGIFSGSMDFDPSSNDLVLTSALDSNAYIASYSSTGTLNWVNQIKGRAYITGVASDAAGNFFVAGYFAGTTYFDVNNAPTTYTQLPGSVIDIFLIKYNSSGVLQWKHTFGSALTDKALDMTVDNSGNVIMSGVFVTLIDFDPSPSASFNLTTPQNFNSGYVAKYDNNGNFVTAFRVATLDTRHVVTDNNNNIIINGIMDNFGNFNVAGGNAIVYTVGGSIDYYIAKYDSAGNYIWAFAIGNETHNSVASDINVDAAGNIYFNGYFGSQPYAIDIDPSPDSTFLVGHEAILVKYSGAGNLLWGINTGTKKFNHIAVDANSNPTIIAEILPNVDLDPGPANVTLNAPANTSILIRYSSVGQYLDAQTYTASDYNSYILATSIAITDSNNILIGGYFTGNIDFDAAPGYQNLMLNDGAHTNGFLVSLNQPNYLAQVSPSAAFNSSSTNFCEGVCINFQDNSLYAPNNWNWSFPGATPASSTTQNPQGICYNTPGTYDVQLIVSNPLGADTLLMTNFIVVDAIPQTNAGNDITVCEGSSLQLNGSGATAYSWSPATTLVNANSSNPVASPTNNTTYILTGTNGSCSTTDSINITVNPNPSTPIITPVGIELQSSAAYAYQWYYNGLAIPGATLQNVFPSQIGNYSVTVFDAAGCFASSNTYLVTVVGINSNINSVGTYVISPNPITNQIYILSSKNQNNLVVNLYDMQGKLISTQSTNFIEGVNFLNFPITSLNSGIYRVELNDGSEIHSLKVLKLD